MSKIEELETKLAEMQAELEKLKAEKVAAEWPQRGDEYFSLTGSAAVCHTAWWNNRADKAAASIGNVFRTEQEAEAEIEARKVIAELRRQPGARRFVVGQDNWYIAYSFCRKKLYASVWEPKPTLQQSVWFDSQGSAEAAIQAVGEERIIKAARWWALGEC